MHYETSGVSVKPKVSLSDPKFELRMWREPTWNSMTYWAARGYPPAGGPKAL